MVLVIPQGLLPRGAVLQLQEVDAMVQPSTPGHLL